MRTSASVVGERERLAGLVAHHPRADVAQPARGTPQLRLPDDAGDDREEGNAPREEN